MGLEPERPDAVSIEDYLMHEENQTGGNPSYRVLDGIASIYLEYSPYLRSEHDVMLRGSVSLNQAKFEKPLQKVTIAPLRIVASHFTQNSTGPQATDAEIPEELPDIAYIELPKDSDLSDLDELVNLLRVWAKVMHQASEKDSETQVEDQIKKLIK